MQSNGLSRVFSNTTVQKHQFFSALLHSPTLTSTHDYWKTIALTRRTFVGKVMSLLFNMLSKAEFSILLLLLLLSRFSRVQLCVTPWTAGYQLLRPWDSPDKNTGVGCHFLLQCMKVESESEVTSVVSDSVRPHRWQPTRPPNPGILQARTLEWVAIAFSKFSILVFSIGFLP